MFLEQIEFTELSEDRLCTFVEIFDSSEMSTPLWNKLSKWIISKTERKYKPKTKATIIVCGYDEYNILGEKPNNICEIFNSPVINPPLNSSLDSSSLLSYSVYFDHAVLVTRSGSLIGIGNNKYGQISNTLMKTEISQFTEFSIRDNSYYHHTPISSIWSHFGSLYLF